MRSPYSIIWGLVAFAQVATATHIETTRLGTTPNGEPILLEEKVGYGWNHDSRLVIAEKPGPWFNNAGYLMPHFYGPLKEHYVYAIANYKTQLWGFFITGVVRGQLVVDGEPGPAYVSNDDMCDWNNNPELMHCRGTAGGGKGVWNADFYGISPPALSPDEQQLAYAARLGNHKFVIVLNGHQGPVHRDIPCNPTFSPDGRLFYGTLEKDKFIVFRDGIPLGEMPWRPKSLASWFHCSEIEFRDPSHAQFTVWWHESTPGWHSKIVEKAVSFRDGEHDESDLGE